MYCFFFYSFDCSVIHSREKEAKTGLTIKNIKVGIHLFRCSRMKSSNARIFSAKSITDYMKGQNISVSVPTVIKYLGYLKEAYVIEDIPLYSPKAKAKLNYYYKLYDEDVSLNSIRISGTRYDLTHNLENIVLNELIYLGYEVTVYNNKGREIDFRAVRDGKLYLIQVAYSVAEAKAYDRELRNLSYVIKTLRMKFKISFLFQPFIPFFHEPFHEFSLMKHPQPT